MGEDSVFHKIREAIDKERQKMKGKSPAEKFEYFWMYYKLPFFVIVGLILFIGFFVYDRSQHREYAFHAYFIDASNTLSDELFNTEFGEMIDVDEDRFVVYIDSSITLDSTSLESVTATYRFAAELAAGSLDVCVIPEEYFENYVDQECFGDLRDFLSEEQLSEYVDLLVYQDDVPVGIRADGLAKIQEANLYSPEDIPIYTVIVNTSHPSECSLFLDYLAGA